MTKAVVFFKQKKKPSQLQLKINLDKSLDSLYATEHFIIANEQHVEWRFVFKSNDVRMGPMQIWNLPEFRINFILCILFWIYVKPHAHCEM